MKGGNYLGHSIADEQLSNDSLAALVRLYPPASTKLVIGKTPPADDMYGTLLLEKMRGAGYAISDGILDRAKDYVIPEKERLVYVVDFIKSESPTSDNIRVSLLVGKDVLNRAYHLNGSVVVPAGGWTYMYGE